MDVEKSQRVLPLGFSGTVEENTLHFQVLLLFLSLKRGADLCLSRLVSRTCNTRPYAFMNVHVTKLTIDIILISMKTCMFRSELQV